jgi:beta-lactamase superfamily II metal-dependent hydrolase
VANTAKEVIIPKEPNLFRAVFLYVGQGDSTILVVPDGTSYKYALIDSNEDDSAGGIDLLKLLKDLFKGTEEKLEVYMNTHPHKDHLDAVKKIYKEIGIKQVWHSGHKPGGEHKDVYKDLEYVMKELGEENVFRLKGSREENKLDETTVKLGDINYNVLAPADYVSDEIEDEKPEDRYKRIHEQCGVIRFKYGKDEKQILITGDADYTAWKDHITDYHKDRLPSKVLSAVHHGSNSFFWKDSDTKKDPYKEHLEKIKPAYVVVSAPKSKESRHGHPDGEAMDLYKEEVGEDNLFHLGKKRECIIVDIRADGQIELYPDDELVKEYGAEGDGDGGKVSKAAAIISPVITKIDRKPMGR